MMRKHGTQLAQEYADGRNAFPERMDTSALMFDFLWLYSGALIQWAERATQAVSQWDGLAPEGKSRGRCRCFPTQFGRPGSSGRELSGFPNYAATRYTIAN